MNVQYTYPSSWIWNLFASFKFRRQSSDLVHACSTNYYQIKPIDIGWKNQARKKAPVVFSKLLKLPALKFNSIFYDFFQQHNHCIRAKFKNIRLRGLYLQWSDSSSLFDHFLFYFHICICKSIFSGYCPKTKIFHNLLSLNQFLIPKINEQFLLSHGYRFHIFIQRYNFSFKVSNFPHSSSRYICIKRHYALD